MPLSSLRRPALYCFRRMVPLFHFFRLAPSSEIRLMDASYLRRVSFFFAGGHSEGRDFYDAVRIFLPKLVAWLWMMIRFSWSRALRAGACP